MAFTIESFLTPDVIQMLTTFIIPFLLFFAILLVVTKRTQVFGNNNAIYIILSLGLTAMLYATDPGRGTFQFISIYLVQIGIAGLVISFTGIIIFIFWTLISRGINLAGELRNPEEKLKYLTKKEAEYREKLYHEGNFKKRLEIDRKLDQVEEEMKYLTLKLRRRYNRWNT